jgi:hypothetical protein
MLIVARLAVRFLPVSQLFSWVDRPVSRVSRFAADEADWVAWAVAKAGAHRRIDAVCLPRALAAHAMLRRRGIPSRLCLGVARDGGDLRAHAWIEVGDRTIVGGEEAAGFVRLTAYGG